MSKFFLLCLACLIFLSANAQTDAPTVDAVQPFGKIDKADLEATTCFEPDANAEILFDKGSVTFTSAYHIMFERHIRVKIFNEKGKDEGNIRIEYFGGNNAENINSIEAETINLNNGNIEFVKVDKANIYRKPIDKFRTALTFSFPNVQPGSVIEFKYTLIANSVADFPDWYFQNRIPTRYSEFNTAYTGGINYNTLVQVHHPFLVNTPQTMAIAYEPSLTEEPYMSSLKDNADRILFQLAGIRTSEVSIHLSDTWKKLGLEEDEYDYFGGQFNKSLKDEGVIISKAKKIVDLNDKIAYLFNTVKNSLKWNGFDANYANDGTSDAWNKKTGNSTEINLILFHLLNKADVKVYPMLVSTKSHGKVSRGFSSSSQFNRAVVYIPLSNGYYILDATGKYNIYNQVPEELLNGTGFYFNREEDKFELLYIKNDLPARKTISINAEIKPDGSLSGTAHINSYNYNRTNDANIYNKEGEKKYLNYLTNGDNNIQVSALKTENMEIDSLPLSQSFNFKLDLSGSDGNYIYFSSNLFAPFHINPFINETRQTDIDFSFCNNFMVNGTYKIPDGYKVEALPVSANMSMQDGSLVFRRIIAKEDNVIAVRYFITFKKSMYSKYTYPELHGFYKKMCEMMNEQIILKKA